MTPRKVRFMLCFLLFLACAFSSVVPELYATLFSCALGTMGFAFIIRAPRGSIIPASIIGSLAYTSSVIFTAMGISPHVAALMASALGGLLAQWCARKMKMIATGFTLLSIVGLVPGLGLYRCMLAIAGGDFRGAAASGSEALMVMLMMALGLAMASGLYRSLSGFRRSRHPRKGA